MTPVLDALASQIEAHQKTCKASPLHPHAAAAALAAILERLAAYHVELENLGVTRAELVETSAQIVYRTVTGGG